MVLRAPVKMIEKHERTIKSQTAYNHHDILKRVMHGAEWDWLNYYMIDMIIVAYRFGNILSLARLVSMILQEALHQLFKPFMLENNLFKRSFLLS